MLLKRTNQVYEYKILYASYVLSLAQEVQSFVSQGWEPFGSLAIEVVEGTTFYYQPIVRYVQEEITGHT